VRRRVQLAVGLLLCCFGLALVPFATGARATADATAVITGSETSYTLTWRAGGDEALRCMGLILLPGEVPTAATGPAEWLIRVLPLPGDPQGRWVVHATKQPPGLAPGASLAIQFTTQARLATNQAREIRFSSTCVVGSDVVKQSSGPIPPPPPPPRPPPPPPRPKPCACESLDVQLDWTIASEQEAAFALDWVLGCTKGDGGCAGKLEVELTTASKRENVRLRVTHAGTAQATGATWLVDCRGKCFRARPRTTAGTGSVRLSTPGREVFGPRGIASVTLEVDRTCKRRLTTKRFRVAFNAGGGISLRRSDLNGNGVPDGNEKRKG
jgi:hypothetical protein